MTNGERIFLDQLFKVFSQKEIIKVFSLREMFVARKI